MTERERIDKTYLKVQEKYPDVTDKTEIDRLAIKLDKQSLLIKALCLFLGAILCVVLVFLLDKLKTDHSETTGILIISMFSALYEMVRTFIQYSKVESTYKPVVKFYEKQPLDVAKVLKDCSSKLWNQSEFYVIKEKLYDKEDEMEVGVSNATWHEFFLFFKDSITGANYNLKVKKDVYEEAIIGTEFYIILTKDKSGDTDTAVKAYITTKYSLSPDIMNYFRTNNVVQSANTQYFENSTLYTPNVMTEYAEIKQVKKLLPIFALVFCFLSFFILSIPFLLAALILSIVAVCQQRSKLSITSLIISAVLFVITFIGIVLITMASMA